MNKKSIVLKIFRLKAMECETNTTQKNIKLFFHKICSFPKSFNIKLLRKPNIL